MSHLIIWEVDAELPMALRVQHCKKAMEFFIDLGGGRRAYLQYRELPGKILDFHHTETPFERRGEGIAKLLVKVRTERDQLSAFSCKQLFECKC
ncbi:hypothetical protein COOONC_25351 [Cooperia oncophora]